MIYIDKKTGQEVNYLKAEKMRDDEKIVIDEKYKMAEFLNSSFAKDITESNKEVYIKAWGLYKCVNDNCKNVVAREEEVCSDCIPF